MDSIERALRWCAKDPIDKLFLATMGLVAVCIFVQIGIHNGRTMERTEIEAQTSVYEEAPHSLKDMEAADQFIRDI
jgi:hypothetical protein